MTKREDMEKAFPPVFSNLNLVVVAGNGPVEKCRAGGQQAAASGALLVQYVFLLYRPELHIKGKISIRNLIYKMRYNRPLLGGQQSAHFSLLILWPHGNEHTGKSHADKNMSTICAGLVNERPTNPKHNSV